MHPVAFAPTISAMHLREYLAKPSSMTVSHLRHKMNELGAKVDHDAQIRQWIAVDKATGEFKRYPSPANAYFLELATGGKVKRRDMRPKDWAAIWPELDQRKGPPTRRTLAERRIGPADRRGSDKDSK